MDTVPSEANEAQSKIPSVVAEKFGPQEALLSWVDVTEETFLSHFKNFIIVHLKNVEASHWRNRRIEHTIIVIHRFYHNFISKYRKPKWFKLCIFGNVIVFL